MLSPPDLSQQAIFPADFGARFLVTIDTEEDFDWNKPFSRIHHGLASLDQLGTCQSYFASHSIAPLYLVDWPVINHVDAGALLRDYANSGKAEVGAQLHPWVNPPFDEVVNARNSYTGNLPLALQRAKMAALHDRILEIIGIAPLAYRAGRYGLGVQTMAMLAELGFHCDTSVRAGFDYRAGHGPDYRFFPLQPWWSRAGGGVLEIPPTTVFLGLAGEATYHRLAQVGNSALSLASRLGVVERIALTPEGIPAARACAAIDAAIELGLPLLNFSFHSPSLAPGHTPYVTSKDDVVAFYSWWDQVLDHLERRNVRPTTIREVLAATTPS